MFLNQIFNEDCFETMNKMIDNKFKVDLILTSPPYNTSRKGRKDKYSTRYDLFVDDKTDEEYIQWTIDLFNKYNQILNEDGIVLYNISYSSENTQLIWNVVSDITRNTDFTIADVIIWKKKSALPNNVSPNKLTRITEFIFVLCRKSEIQTFKCNKQVKTVSKFNQNFYENIFNFIEAKNNDGSQNLNKCTYSSELCEKLLNVYALPNSLVYDSFMGTGTTAIACKKLNHTYIGSELSKEQCEYARKRLNNN